MANMKHLQLDPQAKKAPTRDHPSGKQLSEALPEATSIQVHPTKSGNENASIFFVGTATTILQAPIAFRSRPTMLTLHLIENGRASG